MLVLVKIPKIGHVPKYKIWHVELNTTISKGVEEIPNSRAYCWGDKNLRIENTTPFLTADSKVHLACQIRKCKWQLNFKFELGMNDLPSEFTIRIHLIFASLKHRSVEIEYYSNSLLHHFNMKLWNRTACTVGNDPVLCDVTQWMKWQFHVDPNNMLVYM